MNAQAGRCRGPGVRGRSAGIRWRGLQVVRPGPIGIMILMSPLESPEQDRDLPGRAGRPGSESQADADTVEGEDYEAGDRGYHAGCQELGGGVASCWWPECSRTCLHRTVVHFAVNPGSRSLGT